MIVNADDFGLTPGVNRAVVELNELGWLTSATLMARAPYTNRAIELAKARPGLGVGCHVVLLDGEPVLTAAEVPSLVDVRTARLQATLGTFLRRLLSGTIAESDIEREAAAQIGLLQSNGIRLTHIDTHKHTHMFPAVLRPVLRAARAAGIRAVRNPFEPAWSVRATPGAPFARKLEVNLLRRLERKFRHIVAEEGFATTDGAIGVLATGTLDAETVTSLLAAMPEGTWELVTHPGYVDAELAQTRTRLVASREVERNALEAVASTRASLIPFAELHP